MHQYTSNYKAKYGSTGATKTVDRNIDYSTPIGNTVVKVEEKKEEPKVTEIKQDTLQYATYPMRVMRQSAIWNTSSPHIKCSSGSPKDYPTDLVGADSGRDWMYAPCDMIVLRKYTKASHAIWLRSVDKVHTPSGDKYLYMMSEHQDNAEMAAVGHVYAKGEKVFREGKNGNATGYHLHVSFGVSDKKLTKNTMGSGWKKNSKGAWVLYIPGVTNVKIEQALYVNKDFTTTIKDTRINFITVPGQDPIKTTTVKTTKYVVVTEHNNLNVRKTARSNGKIIGSVKKGATIEVSKIEGSWAYVPAKKGYVSIKYIKKK